MFSWVKAIVNSGFTQARGFTGFRKFWGITDEDWPYETMRTTYNRMDEELIDSQRTKEETT